MFDAVMPVVAFLINKDERDITSQLLDNRVKVSIIVPAYNGRKTIKRAL